MIDDTSLYVKLSFEVLFTEDIESQAKIVVKDDNILFTLKKLFQVLLVVIVENIMSFLSNLMYLPKPFHPLSLQQIILSHLESSTLSVSGIKRSILSKV